MCVYEIDQIEKNKSRHLYERNNKEIDRTGNNDPRKVGKRKLDEANEKLDVT